MNAGMHGKASTRLYDVWVRRVGPSTHETSMSLCTYYESLFHPLETYTMNIDCCSFLLDLQQKLYMLGFGFPSQEWGSLQNCRRVESSQTSTLRRSLCDC